VNSVTVKRGQIQFPNACAICIQGEKRAATGRPAVLLPFKYEEVRLRSACGVDGHRQGFAANRRGKLAATKHLRHF
jgi:hypothetical protein